VEEERMIDYHVVEVWTDGSGTTAGNPGGWAYIATGEFERCESGFVSDSTNNRAEMTALLMGLRALEAPAFVLVHADSAILMNPWVNNRFPRWIEKDWRGIQNVDLWKALLAAAEPHTLTWSKVKSHSKVALNEECDKLAGIARRAAIACGHTPRVRARASSPFSAAMAGPDSALCAFLLGAVTFSDATWRSRAGGAVRAPGEARADFIRRVLKDDECSPP
jgi:ribonuclease HI